MSRKVFENLPDPKFEMGQYITDGEDQAFEIDFVEYDFEREEYYYYPSPDTYAGKIFESDAEITEPPKSSAMKTFEMLFNET